MVLVVTEEEGEGGWTADPGTGTKHQATSGTPAGALAAATAMFTNHHQEEIYRPVPPPSWLETMCCHGNQAGGVQPAPQQRGSQLVVARAMLGRAGEDGC